MNVNRGVFYQKWNTQSNFSVDFFVIEKSALKFALPKIGTMKWSYTDLHISYLYRYCTTLNDLYMHRYLTTHLPHREVLGMYNLIKKATL